MGIAFILLLLAAYAAVRVIADARQPEHCTPQAGSRWTGDDRDHYNHDEPQAWAEAFTDYPLYWLGPQFAGYNLQVIDHQPPPAYRESVIFVYGRP